MLRKFQAFLPQLVGRGRRGPLIAALLAVIVALPCALMVPPLDRDESRFVQASSQMLESHDYIDINVQQVPRYKKPVGIHWLQVLAVKLTSKVEKRQIFPYRWPSMLGAALAAFACAWGASRAFGTRAGTKAGLLFAVSFMLSTEAFIAKTDAVLCGLTTLMMACLAQVYLRNRDLARGEPRPKMFWTKLFFWLALAGTILIKGPIGPMILATTIFTLWGWDRKIRWAGSLNWGWGLILVLLICGPWFVAITVATDGQFWVGAVGHDLASKLSGGSEGHFMWPGYHLGLLPITLFPASWLLGGALQTAISRRHEAGVRFAIAWFLPAFIIFELSPTKLPHYPLPTFGALIWLCALSLDAPRKTWAKIINGAAGLIGGLVLTALAIVGYALYGTPPDLVFVAAVALGALVIAGVGGWLMLRRQERLGFGFLLAAGIITHLSVVSLLVQLKPLWVSKMMEQALVSAHLDPRQGIAPGPVAVLGYAEPSFVFAMGTRTELDNGDAQAAAAALADGRPVFVDSKFDSAFEAQARALGVKPHAVSQVKGHNYNGHDVVITLYDNPPRVSP
ncbi:glycosyltransferase family 39 protein [Asticcacaulis sp. EMRT-3]|nr:glycosyltransferase family 39 protein [Asticcacaulis sp. EMRT-3]MDI7773783.1 glycosyltransferase family 39 protein [Asticcacaulis sp. EMRT-3]